MQDTGYILIGVGLGMVISGLVIGDIANDILLIMIGLIVLIIGAAIVVVATIRSKSVIETHSNLSD